MSTHAGHEHHRWELIVCAIHGHMTYRPDDDETLARGLSRTAGDSTSWRCLRCGCFVEGEPEGHGESEDAPLPRRGPAIREAFVMRFLAAERIIRALILYVAAYGVWKFSGSKTAISDALRRWLPDLHRLAAHAHYNLDDAAPMRLVNEALGASGHTLDLVVIGLIAYATIELAEGVGLWVLKRWGEYVAVIGTSIFLPLEIYELTEKFSVLKVITLAINLALVVWLIYSKRLFGVRGGGAAYEAQHESASVIELTKEATS